MKALVQKKIALIIAAVLVVGLVAAGCSGDGNGDGTSGTLSTAQLQELAARSGSLLSGVYSTPQGTGIHVIGVGRVTVEPDLAVLSLGVESFAATVSEGRATAAQAMDGIIATFRDAGVADQDIQTAYFNIRPEYVWEEVFENGLRRSERRLIGYTVTNTLTVKVRDLDSVGPIIDGAVEAGGDVTRINSIRFTIEEGSALEEQARLAAVRDAVRKAGLFADESGVSRGQLEFITEVSSPQFVTPEASFDRADDGAAAVPTAIMAGELEITVRIQAVFAID